jgi:deoxyribodipyrimidine photo-lyase
LNALAAQVDTIIPVFILDPNQIEQTPMNKHYFSPRAARFILDSLIELNKLCNNKLCVVYGGTIESLFAVCSERHPTHISFNADYSEYALQRDKMIIDWCAYQGIETIVNYDDQNLHPMDTLIKTDGSPYMVYGPFYKHATKQVVPQPKTSKFTFINPATALAIRVDPKYIRTEYKDSTNHFTGGRSHGLTKLHTKSSIEGFKHRDILSNKSFEISPYLNFGCLSVREVYHYFKKHKIPAAKELYWRDFFQCILRYKPGATSYNQPMDKSFNRIKWREIKSKQSMAEWKSFINCSTGYLLIDAGMKQLQTTGYIGNRMRLLLATFWTKYLMIDPFAHTYGAQDGFSRMLTDCSTSQNKLNHQWITSELDLSGRRFAKKNTPPISGRMIRVDNQMIGKYDPDLSYISTWLPDWKGKSKKDVKSVKPIFEWEPRYTEYCSRIK